jgi:hypothetical protein
VNSPGIAVMLEVEQGAGHDTSIGAGETGVIYSSVACARGEDRSLGSTSHFHVARDALPCSP